MQDGTPRKSTPNKLKGIDVLQVLRDNDFNVRATARQLNVSERAIVGWKKANGVIRQYVQVQS